MSPQDLRPIHAETILMRWRKHYAAWTVYTRRGILQHLLNSLTAYGAPRIRAPKIRQPPPRPVIATQAEIAQALAIAKPHERLLILLCWQTALRSNEAATLTVSAWNREAHTVTTPTKGGKVRTLPVTNDIEEMLAAATACASSPDQPAIEALRGHRLSRHTMNIAWWKLKKKAGINPELRLHDLRRTTATNLYRISKDIRGVQEYLGHSQLQSTTHYLAPLGEQGLRELQKLLAFHSEVKQ
jgi:integrase